MFGLHPASGRHYTVMASLVFMLVSLIPVAPVGAQTTSGTLVGRIIDAAGGPVGGARVTAINELNGNARSTVTDGQGNYRIPFLPPGRYTIRATAAGFAEGAASNFPIPLNSTTNIVPDITLASAAAPTTGPAPTTTGPPTAPVGGQVPAGESRASLVNLSDPERSGNFDDRQVETLPLGGTTEVRTFDELALLVPGVVPSPYVPGIRGPGIGIGVGTAGQFSVNGLRARSNNFTIDGSDNNDPDVGVRRQGFVTLVPQSIESIQEFQISTLLWDAELGRNMASQVNAVSRTGGNEVHGQVYGFFTDSRLNARNFFDYEGGASQDENPYTRVQAGFVVGGPIVVDRTQFFASAEFLGINSAVEQHFASPTLVERFANPFFIFGPVLALPNQPDLLVGFPTGITPAGAAAFSLYPLPNNPGGPYGANTYSEVLPSDGEGVVASFKVNHQFNENHSMSARYNFTDDERALPSVNRAIRSTINAETRTQNLSLIFDSGLSPTLFNQARVSYGRTRLDFPEYPTSPFLFEGRASTVVVIEQEAPSLEGFTSPVGQIIVEPYSPVGVDVFTFPQGRVNNTFQAADTVSYTWRTHSMKFGADVRRNHLNSFQERNYRPLLAYSNSVQGLLTLDPETETLVPTGVSALSGLSSASLGLASSVRQTITAGVPDSTIGLRFTEYDFFFNDNWRVRPNFTLDFGLRYEYNTVPSEVNDRIERALSLQDLPQPGGLLDVIDRPTADFILNAFNASVGAYRQVLGGRTKIYDSDSNNLGPHVGFAWDPFEDNLTAVRGGYGIYYDTILGAVVSQSRNVFPNEVPLNFDPTALTFDFLSPNTPSQFTFRGILPFIAPGTLNQLAGGPENFATLVGFLLGIGSPEGGLAFTLPAKELDTPYAQHWHLTLERQVLDDYLLSAAYVGTKGTHLTRLTTPNLGPDVTPLVNVAVGGQFPIVSSGTVTSGAGVAQQRPIPALGAFQIYENTASSIYHSLQLEARKRYSRGYTFTAAYTWSHAIDDVSDVFPLGGASNLAQDSFNFRLERADANYDVRHRFATSVVWDLPFYRDAPSYDADDTAFWLGSWQLATIFQTQTGQPFTLNVAFDANLDGNLTDRPSTTNGLVFVDEHGPTRVRLGSNLCFTDFINTGVTLANEAPFFRLRGVNGAVGRNTVRADGIMNWDLALNKFFRFSEVNNLEIRAEVFNVLNRANFGIPIRVIGSPGFGSSVDTVTPARTIQFALKYSF